MPVLLSDTVIEPGPLPLVGLRVTHGWFAAAVHVTDPVPLTVNRVVCGFVLKTSVPLPLFIAPKFNVVGESVTVGSVGAVVPVCVTANACPPIAIVAERADEPVYAPTLYETDPFPLPLDVVVTHVAPLEAVHAHPVPAVTPTVPEPPKESCVLAVGESEYVQPLNVKPFARLPLCPSVLVMTTLTAPAACAGETAVMLVADPTATELAAVPPMVTVAPDANPVPVIVTAVPPLAGPLVGENEMTDGGGAGGAVVPVCVMANVCAAMVTVADRDKVLAFAATLYETVPFPLPVDVVVTHAALLEAVHPHPAVAVTPMVPDPAEESCVRPVGEREYVQPVYVNPFPRLPLCASEFVTTTLTAPAA